MFEGERRDAAMSHFFFPSWLCTMGKAGSTPEGFSHWTTEMCIDLLRHFKVPWDHFASLDIIHSSKCSLREGCPECPGWASPPTAPQLSLHLLALPSSTSSSLILMSFSFVHLGFLSSVKDKGAAHFSPDCAGDKPAQSVGISLSGCRCLGFFLTAVPSWCCALDLKYWPQGKWREGFH